MRLQGSVPRPHLSGEGWDSAAPDPPVEIFPGVTAALSLTLWWARRWRTGIREVQRIVLEHRAASTPVALVRNGQQVRVTTLGDFLDADLAIDMSTMMIVGNRQTTRLGDYLVSRRVPREISR